MAPAATELGIPLCARWLELHDARVNPELHGATPASAAATTRYSPRARPQLRRTAVQRRGGQEDSELIFQFLILLDITLLVGF
jgi:hypothetical protein